VRIVNWERVRRGLHSGSVDKARAVAESASASQPLPAAWIPFANDIEDESLGEIRIALADMELDRASALMDAEFKRQRGRVLRQIKLHLLQAKGAFHREDRSGVRRGIRNALRLAQPGRFIRCFLDEGGEILQILREEYQQMIEGQHGVGRVDPDRDFMEDVLAASGTDLGRSLAAAQVALQPLTDREREMLILLANGFSNKDMGEAALRF